MIAPPNRADARRGPPDHLSRGERTGVKDRRHLPVEAYFGSDAPWQRRDLVKARFRQIQYLAPSLSAYSGRFLIKTVILFFLFWQYPITYLVPLDRPSQNASTSSALSTMA